MTQGRATDVMIVGAGLAGLMAGRVLADAGKRVLLLDQGRSVGGRLATRQIGGGAADYGAQFFTVRAPEFSTFVTRWLAEGIVFEWSRGWSDGSLNNTRDGHPRYAVRGGMNALAQQLAQNLNTRVKVKVATVKSLGSEGWQVEDETGATQRARAILLTPPVPQSLILLDHGGVSLADPDRAALEGIDYYRSLTGLFVLDRELRLPAPGAIQRPYANIRWIADNKRKGISPEAVVITAQAGAVYSSQLWDRSDEEILAAFRVDLLPVLGDSKILESQLKRWSYAQPSNHYEERYLMAADQPAPLAFAGDAFGGPRIEGACLSGLAAGQALLDALK